MKQQNITQIQDLTKSMAQMLVEMEPKTAAEWDAMEKLTAAHKQMRSIDITGLVEREPRAPTTR